MSFASCYIICLKQCNRRHSASSPASDLLCDFDGRSVIDHALQEKCGDPQGDRFERAGAIGVGTELAAAAVQRSGACGCGGKGGVLRQALRRVELLEEICRGCDQMVAITVRERPLVAGVTCKAVPGCCGAEAGTVDLLSGACIELKHEAAIAQWKKECAAEGDGENGGGEACH